MTNRQNQTEAEFFGGNSNAAKEKKPDPLCLLSLFDLGAAKDRPGQRDEPQVPSSWGADFFASLANRTAKTGLVAEKTGLSGDKLAPVQLVAPADRVSAREAELLLQDSVKDLRLTTDGSLPRLARFDSDFEVKEKNTVRALAEARLGPKASKAQIELFIDKFGKANLDLDIEGGDDELEAGAKVVVPGQDRTGGIYTEDDGRRSTTWATGSSKEEIAEGLIINAKGKAREVVFFINEHGDPPSSKTVIKGKVAHQVRQDGLEILSKLGAEGASAKVQQVTRADKSIFTLSYEKDSDEPGKITYKKPGAAPTEYRRNDVGEYVSRDGKKGLTIDDDSSIALYDRQVKKDGSITRTYENKDQTKCDKEGNLIYSREIPNAGLKIERFFKPKEDTPTRVVIEHDELNRQLGRRGPIELSKTPAGRFVATVNCPDGRTKLGTVELSREGTVSFLKSKDLTSTHWINPRGNADTKMTVSATPCGDHSVRTDIAFGDGAKVSRLHDRFGIKKTESYTDPSGAKWNREFNSEGKPESLRIIDDALDINLKHDRSMRMFKGTVKEGGITREATLCRDTLFIRGKDGKLEARALEWNNGSRPRLQKGGYDMNRSTFTGEETINGRKTRVRESIIPGVTDRIRGSTVEGIMSNGVKSSINFMGEAIVERPEGSAVKLGPDNRVDIWDESGRNSVRGEALSREALDFLKKYPDTDRRVIAEIHRRFRADADSRAKSEGMFKKLSELDGIKGLSAEQKQALRHSVLTHVAFPEAITQGDPTFVCGAATMQRQLAINHPDKYASTLVSALSGSALKNIGGKDVKFEQSNLLMHDTTGRDIASRAFQTLAISLAHSKLKFENTSTGMGRLIDTDGHHRSFTGLRMDRMAMVLSTLTESPKAVVTVNSQRDLIKLFSENQGTSMALMSKPKGSELAHVYNLVGIEEGPPLKLRIQDHSGLTGDMSDAKTALMDLTEVFGDSGEATVIFGGKERLDPKQAYTVEEGKVVVDEKRSKESAEAREREED